MQAPSTYRSKLYRDFRAIGQGDWRGIVRFYEKHEADIRGLDFEEYFELLLAYTDALFEIGAWQKHLLMADVVIETSVMENLPDFNGKEVFCHTLFRKAASHFNLLELERTEHILRELLRIAPDDADTATFLRKCLRTKRPALLQQSRALAVLFFLLASVLVLLEIFVVRNFYPRFVQEAEVARTGVFLLGLVVLAGGEVLHRWRCGREVKGFLAKVKGRRKAK